MLAAMFPNLRPLELFGAMSLIKPYRIERPEIDGTAYLEDIWALEEKFGFQDTYSFSWEHFNYELYSIFWRETLTTLAISLVTVILVVLTLTVNVQVTIFVVSSLMLVCASTLGMAYHFGLSFNLILALNLSLSLGIAVDYAVHIANTYLSIKAPVALKGRPQAQREFKAREAISEIGSSVLHGGISTLLVISVIGFAKLISFQYFFKTWMTFVTIGMLNGLVLLPIILSMCGPLDPDDDDDGSNTQQS